MAQHAELLERRQRSDNTFLYFRLYDDTAGELGRVEVPDGAPADIKTLLRQEVQRINSLPVGKIIDL